MAASSPGGLLHAAACYGSEAELLATTVPFCEDGLRRGEPTLVRLPAEREELLRGALQDADRVAYLPHAGQYPNPPDALANVVRLVEEHTRGGRTRVRILGELPPLTGLGCDAWIRYESAVNRLVGDQPVTGLCLFDTATTPDDVLAEVVRTHHALAGRDGALAPNGGYEAPHAFMRGRRAVVREPVLNSAPSLELLDPTPAAGRRAIGALAAEVALDVSAAGGLLIAVSELITNGLLHGRPPVTVRAWGRLHRVVVEVRDGGRGPADPFAGILPVEPGARVGGLGLWIAHQLCPEIALSWDAAGFAVRLAVGTGAPLRPSRRT